MGSVRAMFATRLSEILRWVDNECPLLSPENMRDGFRTRILELTRDFLAFPHCENFALMPDPYGTLSSLSSTKPAASSGEEKKDGSVPKTVVVVDPEEVWPAGGSTDLGKRKR